jgi:uncharacterized protein involved in exopolysaccharide biosynthesis
MAERRSRRRLIVAGIPVGIALALSVLFTPPLVPDGRDPT